MRKVAIEGSIRRDCAICHRTKDCTWRSISKVGKDYQYFCNPCVKSKKSTLERSIEIANQMNPEFAQERKMNSAEKEALEEVVAFLEDANKVQLVCEVINRRIRRMAR